MLKLERRHAIRVPIDDPSPEIISQIGTLLMRDLRRGWKDLGVIWTLTRFRGTNWGCGTVAEGENIGVIHTLEVFVH